MPRRPRNQSNPNRSANDCLSTLRKKLAQNMQLEAGHGRKFISVDCLKQIWSDKDLQEYILEFGMDWGFIEQNLLKTLSILAWIHWDDWPELVRVFIDHKDSSGDFDRLDRHLPYPDKAVLASSTFLLNEYFAELFYDTQYMFLPVTLAENRDLEYPRYWRLPFISETETMGTGSYGTVTKVVVAKGHFMNAQGNMVTWEKPLARKRLEFEPDFRKEVQNLRMLKRNQLSHSRIMKHCGSLIHGNDCNIFFEWAEYNTQDLLFERCDTRTCPAITPVNLLREASYLAGALWFLHHQLDDIFCCHMDLKPDNILVVQDDDSPVGQWMITDFGISVFFKEPSRNNTNNEFLSVRELEENIRHQTTRTVPKRRPGPFQPPEVESIADAGKVGRKGDVWSFGCVLTMILAFALGGREAVEEFDTIRGSDSDLTDYFYELTTVTIRSRSAQIPEVKPAILSWLNSLSGRYPQHTSWISKSVSLIKATLSVEQKDRPEAIDIKDTLKKICSEMDGRSTPNLAVATLTAPLPPGSSALPVKSRSLPTPYPHQSRPSVSTASMLNATSMLDLQSVASRASDAFSPFFDHNGLSSDADGPSIGWRSSHHRDQRNSGSISPTQVAITSSQSSLSTSNDGRTSSDTRDALVAPESRSTPSPLEADLSEIESNDNPSQTPNPARRSTTVSLSPTPSVTSAPLKFDVPPDAGLQTTFSPVEDKIVFLSKTCAYLYSLPEPFQVLSGFPEVKINGTWWRASLAGQFLALLGVNSQVIALHRLDTEPPSTVDVKNCPTNLARLTKVIVSSRGDLALRIDNEIHIRNFRTGKWDMKRMFHNHGNLSKEKLRAVCFGPSGEFLFAWSCGSGLYHWYVWRVSDVAEFPAYCGSEAPTRFFDKAEPLMFPSFTEPVVFTYEHHSQKASIMRHGNVRSKRIEHLTTGVLAPSADVVFLLRQCTPRLGKDFYVVDMLELQVEKDGAYSFGKCQQLWDSKKSRLKVVKDTRAPRPTMVVKNGNSMASFIILIAQIDGYVERIEVND